MNKKIIIAALAALFSSFGYAQENDWGKISGQFFVDYFYNIARDGNFSNFNNSAVEGTKDLNGFLLRRASLNYDKNISDKFSARFRLEADSKSNTSNNRIGVFVKDASLKWKNIFEGSDLIFGIQPTPSFDVSEKYWGYRSLEKTIQDLRNFVPSRDFGIALRGKIAESGNANYTVMFGNNSANSPETDKYKRYYAAVDFSPINNFTIALTGDFKSRASVQDPRNENATLAHNSILSSLFLGYGEKNKYSLGVETVFQFNQNDLRVGGNINPELKSANALGISAFGSYWFTETIAALLRYDYFDPNMDELSKGNSRNYIIAGVDFKADKNISFIPNVIYESYESLPEGTSFGASMTGRLTLYYNF
ncbi:MAG: hypothetical protein Q8M94_21680 [Ignavibacteria bacterium]|nr:hypothetical protein [Ignavibacteria bacterium]